MRLCKDDHEEVCYEGLECPACAVLALKNVCDDGHEEIWYDVVDCPMCKQMRLVDKLTKRIDVDNETIRDLEERMNQLEKQLDSQKQRD